MIIYLYDGRKSHLIPHSRAQWADFYTEADLEQWLEHNPAYIRRCTVADYRPAAAYRERVCSRPDWRGRGRKDSRDRAQAGPALAAQVTEYAAQLATLEEVTIREMANRYLSQQQPPRRLAQAWYKTFGQPLPQDLCLNRQRRIILIVEGADKRTARIVRYMRSQGFDISLLAYRLYVAEDGEILLSRQLLVGDEQEPVVQEATSGSSSPPAYTVEAIRQEHPRAYERWTEVEEAQLAQRRHAGLEVEELARLHQRQPDAIRSRLHRLGLLSRSRNWSDEEQAHH